ncbi:hypothetical protein [Pseudoalteromonas byunsanensis]|uniref:Uncharacterized protein n=1 Tax=Pseudoalteromonas byunsanensis TaxID=327939 RepID=A0A1S1N5D2_9GAMM|nr:hypothetical protein [Pseudoalteromonas byunsanensis]OHU93839.1 hypothetical protein BIW53_16425 [Pseudoalteromonas byunsanensis]
MKSANLLNIFNIGLTNSVINQKKLVNQNVRYSLSLAQCNLIAGAGAWKPTNTQQTSCLSPLPKPETQGG